MRGRPLRGLGLALVLVGLLELLLSLSAPAPPARVPLCFQNPMPIPWGTDLPGSVHVTAKRHQLVDLSPPADRLRFVLLGESAVSGVVFHPERSLPTRLQRRLLGRGLDAEVVNLGFPGFDSGHLKEALDRSLQELRPQAVIVYCGNNEFIRLRGYRQAFPAWNSDVERLRLFLEGFALYRHLSGFLAPPPVPVEEWKFPRIDEVTVQVSPGDVVLAREHYTANLAWMARRCRDAGIPLVLCTVATNDLYGREGTAARDDLLRAKETDPAPRRALPSFLEVVRGMQGMPGLVVCDVDRRLREQAPEGILGWDLFADYCHFTSAGVDAVASALEDGLASAGLLPSGAVLPSPLEDPLDLEHWGGGGEGPAAHANGCTTDGRWDEAEEAYLAALAAEPRRAALWANLARVRKLRGDLRGALEALDRYAPEGAPDPVVLRDRALLQRLLDAGGRPAWDKALDPVESNSGPTRKGGSPECYPAPPWS